MIYLNIKFLQLNSLIRNKLWPPMATVCFSINCCRSRHCYFGMKKMLSLSLVQSFSNMIIVYKYKVLDKKRKNPPNLHNRNLDDFISKSKDRKNYHGDLIAFQRRVLLKITREQSLIVSELWKMRIYPSLKAQLVNIFGIDLYV